MKYWFKAFLPFIILSSYICLCIIDGKNNSWAIAFLNYFLVGIMCEMIFILKTRTIHDISTWSFIKELIFWPQCSIIEELPNSIKFFKYKLNL